MAGLMEIVSSTNLELQNSTDDSQTYAIINQWQVQYGRFINHSSTNFTPTHPSLTIPAKRVSTGTWISAAIPASLKLLYTASSTGSDDAVLVISIPKRLLEEHCISKMHFSWPQVSCVSGFPARGSRAVFVSYKDDAGQIQKFALRFATASETEKFMNFLKILYTQEILTKGSIKQLQCSEFNSEMSSQAEVIPSEEPPHRPDQSSQFTTPEDVYTQPMIPSLDCSPVQESITEYKVQDPEPLQTMSDFPPSFTQLLKNCHPEVDEAKPIDCEKNLTKQFARYLEGTSIKELLATVENVLDEYGDDLLL